MSANISIGKRKILKARPESAEIVYYYIPRRKLGIYWIQVRCAAVEISLWTR